MRTIFLAVLALVVLGCGSRKRAMEKQEQKLDYAAESDTAVHAELKNDIVVKSESTETHHTATEANAVEVGPGGRAVIEEFDTAGNLKKRATIEGNARAGNKKEETAAVLQVSNETHDNSTASIDAAGSKKETLQTANKSKAVATERKGVGVFWLWFFVIVIVLLLVFAWFRRKKKKVL